MLYEVITGVGDGHGHGAIIIFVFVEIFDQIGFVHQVEHLA